MLQENQPVAISAITGMGGIGKTELALQYALRYSQIDVGAKHLGDNLSGKPKALYPNASPSQDLGDNLSGKPKALYPNASPSQDLGDNLSGKSKALYPNASPSQDLGDNLSGKSQENSPNASPSQDLKTRPIFYPGGICWFLARGLDLGIQIVDFARVHLQLNPPEDFDLQQRVAYCWRNWIAGNVLVVIDDVTDYQKVKPYLPPREGRFKVLMTTRLELPAPIVRLDLQVLTGKAALNLLKSLIGAERIEAELEVGKNICKWLGYLPLGLELVGRYLRRKLDLSLAEMLSRLRAKRLQQLGLKKPKSEATMTGQLGVRDAFELSWLELDKSGQDLGLYLSLFALAPIPWQLVVESLPDIDAEELEETRDYGLVNLHLIQRSEKDTYQLHPLIREFLIAKGEELGIADDRKRGFCQVMVGKAEEIPDTPTLEDIEKVNLAIPHIAAAATSQQDWLRDDDLIWPFVGLGRFYKFQVLYQKAVDLYEDCLSVTRKRLGENHPYVTISLNNLAGLYKNQGKYDEAQPLYLEAVEIAERILGINHPHTIRFRNNLQILRDNWSRE